MAIAAGTPSRRNASRTAAKSARPASGTGGCATTGGSCATTRLGRPGWRARAAGATTALELEPKSAAGAPSGDSRSISRTMSSACVTGDWSVTGPSSKLREQPRGS
ncbi:hypothetical protein [Streptomyces sp. YIM 132580]|uniref:hypothetical protein n=1 Tax=Streptomyces sp. YIM 132580 TaxID=2691958 RepID=UPI00192538E6|nr:hypothetical protein [Streptomyces sp. YIM 132580]